jgi:flagellar hook protein FlgE
MLRSLFAGISGLRVNQTMLDVTGNNIANANTAGYKSSSTVFSDTLSQMLTSSSAPNPGAGIGGTNPIQVGLGVQVAATNMNFSQGSSQSTGRPTDLMLNGDGFFVIQSGGTTTYTRAGAFNFDAGDVANGVNPTLVNPSGGRVQGFAVDGTGTADTSTLIDITLPAQDTTGTYDLQSYEIGRDGKVTCTFEDGSKEVIAQIAIADFANPMGLNKTGETSFGESTASGVVQLGVSGQGTRGSMISGAIEMSNVDLAQEFTNLILAQRGFQASSRIITTSDQVLEELVNIKR